MTRITFHHGVGRLKAGISYLRNRKSFMIGLGGFEIKLAYEKKYFKSLKYLFSRDDWSISNQRKVNSGIWNQVCLELIEINIEGSVEPQ